MLLWTAVLLLVPCIGETAWLKLQVWPNPVFEGDVLTLQCSGERNAALSRVHFFRDGKPFHFSKDNQLLSMGTATVKSSGRYSCAGQVTSGRHVNKRASGTVMVQVQELFPPPVLSAIPSHEPREGSPVTLRCQTKLHPKSPLCAAPAPVSSPLLTLRPRPTGLAVGYGVELLCEAQRGSPPILYSFYLNGEMLGNHTALRGGAASFLFLVKSEQDAGNYTCKAENRVSEETSKPETLSVVGRSCPATGSEPSKPAGSGLGKLLESGAGGRHRLPRRISHVNNCLLPPGLTMTEPLIGFPPQGPSGHLGLGVGEQVGPFQAASFLSAHFENGEDAGVVYTAVRTTPKKSEAMPAESSQQEEDFSVIYAEMRCLQLREVPAQGLNRSSRTHQDPTGDYEEVLRQ
nr:Fc receptor-like protein 6 [Vicugna pacos]